ncbi:MAG: DNA replication and repair protein RecF [Treponemataceae bacterium]|nr:DNA replication and repair protein RecF [Treponemataceae bacterium]
MPILSISLNNFRNLQNATIDLLSKEVYFVGENGQGKSNLLESIYMSSYGNSFKTHADAEIPTNGTSTYCVKTFFREESGATHTINISYDGNKTVKKTIIKNGKKIQDRKEMINTIPCVLFCHEDLEFAIGQPERRRFFLDQSLSMYDVMYIDVMRRYKKVLKSRNLLLKEKKYETIEAYNYQLAENGREIVNKRKNTVYQFNRIFSDLFEKVTGIRGVYIAYDPSWKSLELEDILNTIHEKFEMDKALGTTMSGPHRDRIRFVKGSKQFIPSASTGQRRLVSIILRIAQAKYYSEITQKKPILLMDDVLLELDPDKRQRITALLPDYEQLFCTFLPGEPYERYKKTTTKIFNIDKGHWNEQQ